MRRVSVVVRNGSLMGALSSYCVCGGVGFAITSFVFYRVLRVGDVGSVIATFENILLSRQASRLSMSVHLLNITFALFPKR